MDPEDFPMYSLSNRIFVSLFENIGNNKNFYTCRTYEELRSFRKICIVSESRLPWVFDGLPDEACSALGITHPSRQTRRSSTSMNLPRRRIKRRWAKKMRTCYIGIVTYVSRGFRCSPAELHCDAPRRRQTLMKR